MPHTIVINPATGLSEVSPAPTPGSVAAMVQDNFAKLAAEKVATSAINAPNGVAGLDGDGAMVGTVKLRQGTAAQLAAYVLAAGEPGWATDTKVFKVGDGVTTFASLPSAGAAPWNTPSAQNLSASGATSASLVDSGTYQYTLFTGNGTARTHTLSFNASGMAAGARAVVVLSVNNIDGNATGTGTLAAEFSTSNSIVANASAEGGPLSVNEFFLVSGSVSLDNATSFSKYAVIIISCIRTGHLLVESYQSDAPLTGSL